MKSVLSSILSLGISLFLTGHLFLPSIARAEVNAVGIELKSEIGSSTYVVPDGKALIVEHVAFSDSWIGKPFAIVIRFSANAAGAMFMTTITYNQKWNSLLRPIRLPAGKGVSIQTGYGVVFKCFLYGLLVDEADLYAGVPAKIDSLQVVSSESGQQVSGQVELRSPRPSHVVIQQTETLGQWQTASALVQGSAASPSQKSFAMNVPSATHQAFFRAHGRTGDELLAPLTPVPSTALAVEDIH
jgi:hypothetical protein